MQQREPTRENWKETTRKPREQAMCCQSRERAEDAALKAGVMAPPIKAGWLASSKLGQESKGHPRASGGVRPAIP